MVTVMRVDSFGLPSVRTTDAQIMAKCTLYAPKNIGQGTSQLFLAYLVLA
jgi:hypothetical protein